MQDVTAFSNDFYFLRLWISNENRLQKITIYHVNVVSFIFPMNGQDSYCVKGVHHLLFSAHLLVCLLRTEYTFFLMWLNLLVIQHETLPFLVFKLVGISPPVPVRHDLCIKCCDNMSVSRLCMLQFFLIRSEVILWTYTTRYVLIYRQGYIRKEQLW